MGYPSEMGSATQATAAHVRTGKAPMPRARATRRRTESRSPDVDEGAEVRDDRDAAAEQDAKGAAATEVPEAGAR